MRNIITLACTDCKQRNYTTTKNKRTMQNRLELKKYCKFCRSHKVHRETKQAESVKCRRDQSDRPVALMDRAPDSKSGCWGFKSLLACQFYI